MALDEDEQAFGHGIAIGFALAAIAVHLALVAMNGDWESMYRDLGHPLPFLVQLSVSTAWRIGVPGVGGVMIGTLIVRRPRGATLYVAVAIAMALATAITWWYPTQPLRELAGKVHE